MNNDKYLPLLKMDVARIKHLKAICSNCDKEFFKGQMIDMNDNPFIQRDEDWVCYLDGDFNSCYMQMVEASERED
jgi:hypothetical protein|tara:strand:- start:234 stop:458 length:225 start_codon:yes stop_codon:yes gene_type:complete